MKIEFFLDNEKVKAVIKSGLTNEEKASKIFDIVKDYMQRSNGGIFTMPFFEDDIIEFLENYK